jgi:hypothetical protein
MSDFASGSSCTAFTPPAGGTSGGVSRCPEPWNHGRVPELSTDPNPTAVLAELEERGADLARALAFFDSLASVTTAAMIGRWRGSGVATGHPMDGLLERYGWYGKDFVSEDEVHPLLFRRGDEIYPVDPAKVPLGLLLRHVGLFRSPMFGRVFATLGPLARARRSGARLRMLEFRGVVSATMIYDALPIHDAFRRVDEDAVLGVMDLRSSPPFVFILRRDR